MLYTTPTIEGNKSLLPLADHKSRILILDTIPGEKSKILLQYYASRGNNFWKILFNVFGEQHHTDYKLKKQLLLRNGIALWNVLEQEDIAYERPNDFQTFFQMHSTITKIIFNGNNATECYSRHIGYRRGINYTTLPSTSSLNTWKSFEEKVAIWTEELRKI